MNRSQKGIAAYAHRFGIFCAAVALALTVTSAARAQVSGAISGTAADSSGAVLPGVNVAVQSLETGAIRAAVSDGMGRYSVLSLPVGRYEVRAQKAGFRTEVRTGITLDVGQEATVDLVLQLGEIREQVTVTGEAPLVSATPTATAGLVGERQVKDQAGSEFPTLPWETCSRSRGTGLSKTSSC
jgi:hypothetical protein